MRSQSISSPEDQRVTFIELFFDLVFVFSVTQVVSLLHHGLEWIAVGQAILVFWLVWWAWTQFTWALNAADTTHPLIDIGTLIATAISFFMSIAVPDAFHSRALWFAVTYILVRVIGLALYIWVASENPSQRAAVRTFAVVSIGGLVAVLIGGLLGGTNQYWFWGFAILLDVIAATIGAQSEGWNLHPEHFSERHGLFVIITLGETLIVAAGSVTGVEWTGKMLLVSFLTVATICGLWWTYFPRAKPILDEALELHQGAVQSEMARDVFSLIHFPMLSGVIAIAVAIEEALAHPGDPLPLAGRLALAVGLVLFVGGIAVAIWRATRHLLLMRVLLSLGTGVVITAVASVPAFYSLLIALVGIVVIVIIEQRPDTLVEVDHLVVQDL